MITEPRGNEFSVAIHALRAARLAVALLTAAFLGWQYTEIRGYGLLAVALIFFLGGCAGVLGWVALRWVESLVVEGRRHHDDLRRAHGRTREELEQRTTLESALRASEERYRLLAEHSLDAIYLMRMTPSRQLLYMSPSVKDVLGYDPNEFYQNPNLFRSLLHPDDLKAFYEQDEGERRRAPALVRCVRKDRVTVWLEIRSTLVVSADGKTTAVEGLARDVTERQTAHMQLEKAKVEADRANTELREANRSLEQAMTLARQMAEQASSANEAKSQFLAHMSHEIRTPIHAVMGMTDLMRETKLSQEQTEYVVCAETAAESLLTLINDVLDFSKIEAGKLELRHAAFSLRGLLGDTLRVLAIRASEKGLELAWEIDPATPDWLAGDEDKVRQIVVNLVGNAIKFTETGEVVLRGSVEEMSATSALVHLEVTDTGIGIPPDKLVNLSSPYVQGDAPSLMLRQGSGLGLAITAHLAEMMDGQIWYESQTGAGTTFHCVVRLDIGAAQAPPLELPERLRGAPVLVVDDNITNLGFLERMLSRWGLSVTTAQSGEKALDALIGMDKSGRRFTLALIDVQMPIMDGYALATAFRWVPAGAALPIVMLCQSRGRADGARLTSIAAAGSVTKPVKEAELFTMAVRSMLAQEIADAPPPQVLKVLVFEEDPIGRKLTVRLLEKAGHMAVGYGTGQHVLDALASESPDAVVSGLRLPDMTGLELAGRIRAWGEKMRRKVTILALVPQGASEEQRRAFASHMDASLEKPVQPDALNAALVRLASSASPRKAA